MQRIIGIDLDGCTSDFTGYALPIVNKKLGTSYSENDWTEYQSTDCLPVDAAALINEMAYDPDVYSKLIPVDGAVSAIKHLSRAGEVWFITSRHADCKKATETWLKRYEVPYNTLAFTKSKAKYLWVAAYNIDAMIEDNLETAIKVSEYCPLSIVYDRPWNRKPANGIIRCKNWSEILRILLERL